MNRQRIVTILVALCVTYTYAQQVNCANGCLTGTYYSDQSNRKNPTWKYDANINFDWGLGGPRTTTDWFAVVWNGTLARPVMTILADCDDKVKVTIGGNVVLSSWDTPYDAYPPWASSPTTPGYSGAIGVEYAENYGLARCKLYYSNATYNTSQMLSLYYQGLLVSGFIEQQGFAIIPQNFFGPSTAQGTGDALQYYSTTTPDTSFPWFPLAQIIKTQIKQDSYYTGFNSGACSPSLIGANASLECIIPCSQYAYIGQNTTSNAVLSASNVMIRLTMGDYVDYYRPIAGVDLCTMLTQLESHQWAPTEQGPWYTPDYSKYGNGGSDDWWPSSYTYADLRRAPNYWYFSNGQGSCCYSDSTQVTPTWRKRTWERPRGDTGKSFTVDVRYTTRVAPPSQNPTEVITDASGTKSWQVYAQLTSEAALKTGDGYTNGWNLANLNSNKHSQFILNCNNYTAWNDTTVMLMRFGQYVWQNKKMNTTFMAGDPASNVPGFTTYYRPLPNVTLCQMLNSSSLHEWSDDGVNWWRPRYETKMCGGSVWGFPKSLPSTMRPFTLNLAYLPFWCGDTGAWGKYDSSDGGEGSWGKSFQLLVTNVSNRYANRPLADTLVAQNYLLTLLQLGSDSDMLYVKNSPDQWNNRVLDRNMLQLENSTNWRVWPGLVENSINRTDASPVSGYMWQPVRNYNWPPMFGRSSNDPSNNYWVRYWSVCLKPASTGQWNMLTKIDEQLKLWQDGVIVYESYQWSDQERTIPLKPVNGWTQLIFKLYENEWDSYLQIRFDTNVQWQVNATCGP